MPSSDASPNNRREAQTVWLLIHGNAVPVQKKSISEITAEYRTSMATSHDYVSSCPSRILGFSNRTKKKPRSLGWKHEMSYIRGGRNQASPGAVSCFSLCFPVSVKASSSTCLSWSNWKSPRDLTGCCLLICEISQSETGRCWRYRASISVVVSNSVAGGLGAAAVAVSRSVSG